MEKQSGGWPPSQLQRCLRRNQVPDEGDPSRRHRDTSLILSSGGPAHYLTTHRDFFRSPGSCPVAGARRARLLWHFLLHKHAQRVAFETQSKPPEIEAYVTEYGRSYGDEDLTVTMSRDPIGQPVEAHARYPLYGDPPVSFWYQKQELPPGATCRGASQPFRRNALFTTPISQTLYDPPTERT